tara:strand:- start:232 stop:576 length:345 start_codon:yes stop_codon:yes gene_type:complete
MKYKEDNLQKAVAKYLDLKKFLWCHVANERKTSIQAGKRLKLKGVKSGVPDVLIFENSSIYNGLAIELKIKPNYTSENQKEWLKNLSNKGWKTEVCYNFDEVLKVVEEYESYIL